MAQTLEEVLPGIFKIILPVPISSLKTVFVYLFRDRDENVLIDTGWSGEESWAVLKSAFDEIGFNARDLKKIVISHFHPDHFGLSSKLKKASPHSKLMMHRFDADMIRGSKLEFEKFLGRLNDFLAINGVPESDLRKMMEATAPFVKYIDPARPDIRLKGGEKLTVGKFKLQIIWTPGHTKGNICIYDKGSSHAFFSGDHVLPTITPNVSLTPNYTGDPLGDYLASIEAIGKLNPVSKVLPSHEFVFDSLDERLVEINRHHQERLEDSLHALSSGKTIAAYEVASKLHWYTGSWQKLSAWEKRAALLETLAHLEYLVRRNQVMKNTKEKKVYFSRAE
jgi:glyoxylase-like metal-dependent hydrolase (beta-lactamase superfamily II)